MTPTDIRDITLVNQLKFLLMISVFQTVLVFLKLELSIWNCVFLVGEISVLPVSSLPQSKLPKVIGDGGAGNSDLLFPKLTPAPDCQIVLCKLLLTDLMIY